MNPKVSIIILNWNGWKDTIDGLESLYRITYPNYDVIIVDNGSEDDSIEKIKEYCEGKIEVESKFFDYNSDNKPIKIIEYTREETEAGGRKEKEIENFPSNKKLVLVKNEKNYGFAEGNNIGMRYALKALNPDYVLLLNNDTIVDREFLSELVKVGESDPEIGMVGPKIYFYDYNGRKDIINFAGGKINFWKGQGYHIGANEIDKGQYDEIREVDYVEGSCFLIKKEVIEEVGMLDQEYFAYWEEADWCVRAHKAGYKVLHVPKAEIWHKGLSTTIKTRGFVEYHMTRNMFWFMRQHATRRQYLLFLVYFFGFRFWFTSGIHVIYHKNVNAFISFFRGAMDGIKKVHQ